jgi:hypothetical protein
MTAEESKGGIGAGESDKENNGPELQKNLELLQVNKIDAAEATRLIEALELENGDQGSALAAAGKAKEAVRANPQVTQDIRVGVDLRPEPVLDIHVEVDLRPEPKSQSKGK